MNNHAVQLYDDESLLFETVGGFLRAGLERHERVLVIATPDHRDALVRALDAHGVSEAIACGRMLLLDARDTLATFMVAGVADRARFFETLARAIAALGAGRVRAYSEMVDALWRDGDPGAALALDELWDEAGERHAFTLLCAARRGGAVPIRPRKQDLGALVRKILDGTPRATFDAQLHVGCSAYLDDERFQQVLSNVIGNAIRRGDPRRPISVRLSRRGYIVRLGVQHHGDPLDGLALHLTERIVAAHGGKLGVRSSPDDGTELEILLSAG